MRKWIITSVEIIEGEQENIQLIFLFVMAYRCLLPLKFRIIFSNLSVMKLLVRNPK